MQKLDYVIKDEVGIHARPAGKLVKEAKKFSSSIIIKTDSKEADASGLISLMGLGAKCGDKITVEITGNDEAEAAVQIKKFLEENL